MPEETFRLPKSSYDELVKIVQAYGSSGQEATLDEVAKSAVMDKTIISRNNAFLVSVGIIEGGKAKGITEKGRQLSQALKFNVLEDISSLWREIATSNEFLQKMVAAVNIRQGMEESALQSHIAYSAGEPKGPHAMAGAGAVVQILRVAGLVKEQDGKLVTDTSAMQGISYVSLRGTVKEPPKPDPLVSRTSLGPAVVAIPSTSGVSIQIQIQCTAAEIDTLAPKLRTFLKELALKEDGKAEGEK